MPDLYLVWQLTAVTPVPAPLFDVAENRSLLIVLAYCGICMGASLKYK